MNPNSRLRPSGCRRRSGQAIAELIIGLVAILALFAAIIDVGDFSWQQSEVMALARQNAGAAALNDTYSLELPGPQFISDWSPGPDGFKYSADDIAGIGDPSTAVQKLVDPSKPQALATYLPTNEISALNATTLLGGFDLVHDSEKSNIVLDAATRDLLYNAGSIRVAGDVWLVWTRNIK